MVGWLPRGIVLAAILFAGLTLPAASASASGVDKPLQETVYPQNWAHFERIYDFETTPDGRIYTVNGLTVSAFTTEGEWIFDRVMSQPGDNRSAEAISRAPDGNLYLADQIADSIHVLTPDGVFLDDIGGPGAIDNPGQIDVAPDGTIFVSDRSYARIRHYSADGNLIGTYGESGGEGPGEFEHGIQDIEFSPLAGRLYVIDTITDRLQALDPATGEWSILSGRGAYAGYRGLTTDSLGRLYVSDVGNQITVFDASGNCIRQVGSADCDFPYPRLQPLQYDVGPLAFTSAGRLLAGVEIGILGFDSEGNEEWHLTGRGHRPTEIDDPGWIDVGSDGSIWVPEEGNHRITRLGPDFERSDQWGKHVHSGGNLDNPWAVAEGEDGLIYVTSLFSDAVRRFSPDGESAGGIGDIPHPQGMDAGPEGVYVAARFEVALISEAGEVAERITLEPTEYDEGFGLTKDVALAPDGHLYVADRNRIVKLDPERNPIQGDVDPLREYDWITGATAGIEVDSGGNLFTLSHLGGIAMYSPSGEVMALFDPLDERGERGNPIDFAITPRGLLLSHRDDYVYGIHRIARVLLESAAVQVDDVDGVPAFELSSSISGAELECSFDSGPAEPCADLVLAPPAASTPGEHTLSVLSRLGADWVEDEPFVLEYEVVENQPPVASFDYSCSAMECSFGSTSIDADGAILGESWSFGDGATATGPVATHRYESPGVYNVELEVTDDDSASDIASQEVTVLPEPPLPAPEITSGPDGWSRTAINTFTFTSATEEPVFECGVDTSDLGPCSGTGSHETGALSEGVHAFAVRLGGIPGSEPAVRFFAVDTIAPRALVEKGPRKKTKRRQARLVFAADEPAQFRCKLDRKAWSACESPLRLTKLARGRHRFKVEAVDRAGNRQSRPTVARWRIVKRR